jgi:predicted transcriptional regulator
MLRRNAAAVQTNCRSLLQFTGRNDAISEGIKINVTIQQHGLELTGFPQYVIHARNFSLAFEFPRRGKRTKKMPEADKISHEDLLRMTSEVAAAYASHNSLSAAQLPEVIRTIHATLAGLQAGAGSAEPLTPAVPVKKSVHDDYIVCLEDGKKLKMLKRHLRTSYGLTPEEYRQKWGLPADYPMVAPNYAAQRSAFAKKIGLGRTGGKRKGRGRR